MKRRAKSGFIIIEWMIQFTLLTVISTITYALLAQWYIRISHTHRMLTDLLPLYLATDAMRSDIREVDVATIYTQDNTLLISKSHEHIQWHCADQKLFRIKGSYNEQQKRWLKPSKNVIADQVKGALFTKTSKRDAFYISIQLCQSTKQSIEHTITLRNGLKV